MTALTFPPEVLAAKAARDARQARALAGPPVMGLSEPCDWIDAPAECDRRAAESVAARWLHDVLGRHGDIDGTGDVRVLLDEDCVEVSAVVRVFVPLAGGGR